MDTFFLKPGRLALMLGTAAFLAAMPVKFGFGGDFGPLPLKAAEAQAKSGNSGDSDDDDDSSGGSDDDNEDDDEGDDEGDDDDGSEGTPGTGTPGDGSGVSKIEVSSDGIEVSYSDGTREEIENGRYERKNAAGRTIEERPATQADIDRLMALR